MAVLDQGPNVTGFTASKHMLMPKSARTEAKEGRKRRVMPRGACREMLK